MMALRELEQSPRILPLYARAAAPLLPGASLLPFVPGAGEEIPKLELELSNLRSDPERLSAYSKVCGFTLRSELPVTYPHVLAFPLHMALMADHSFPFGAVGLVHVSNRIVQHRPIGLGEPLRLRVFATPLEPHQRGRTFSIMTEGHVSEGLAWEERSTMLHRSQKTDPTRARGTSLLENMTTEPQPSAPEPQLGASEPQPGASEPHPSAEWHLQGDLGRRYASVSGDRNPIHMHALTAKIFGFPRAIAHGMWSKARCLAAFEGRLPEAFAAEVSFRRPILLPAKVTFTEEVEEHGWSAQLKDARGEALHLSATIDARASGT